MTASREEIAQAAMQLERDGRIFYLEVAEKASNALVGRMFEALADDELDHMEWIRNTVPGVDCAATANQRLYQRLRHIFADVPEAQLRHMAQADSDVEAIQTGMEIEKESAEAYDDWAKDCPAEDVQHLCRTIADVERFHLQVLANTLEYFEHTADWFMLQEQWNFEGA
jgi:rubrerythrin